LLKARAALGFLFYLISLTKPTRSCLHSMHLCVSLKTFYKSKNHYNFKIFPAWLSIPVNNIVPTIKWCNKYIQKTKTTINIFFK